MNAGPDDRGDVPVLPASSLPCVWMLAGVLRYRLCDRAYECEQCPLDAAIRGVEPAPREAAPRPAAAPPPALFRDDRRYDEGGAWVSDQGGGCLRWGLDAFATGLLDRITSVVLPAAGTPLERGRTACWIADDGELIPLRSPITGTVLRANQAAQRDPVLVATAPYDAGWFLEAQSAVPLGELPGLCTPAARREAAARQVAKLRHAAARCLHGAPAVGPTAQDGGERLTDLRRILGTGRYHRLVLSVLR